MNSVLGKILTIDKSGKSEKVNPLKKREIESMKSSLKDVDEFLELKGTDDLSRSVKQCFTTWSQLLPLQEENDRAEIVLSAFYQNGKIRDTLIKLKDFVKRMDTVDCDETARGMGYHNYIAFLEQYMNAMKIQYKNVNLCPEKPKCTPDNVAWFIKAECSRIAPIQDLPKVRTAASQMLEQAEVDKQPPERFVSTVRDIGEALQALRPWQKRKPSGESCRMAIEELKELDSRLNARVEALRENIKKGTGLYNALIEYMTDEWFRQFAPESSPVRDMTRVELKSFYQEHLSTLRLPEEEKG